MPNRSTPSYIMAAKRRRRDGVGETATAEDMRKADNTKADIIHHRKAGWKSVLNNCRSRNEKTARRRLIQAGAGSIMAVPGLGPCKRLNCLTRGVAVGHRAFSANIAKQAGDFICNAL